MRASFFTVLTFLILSFSICGEEVPPLPLPGETFEVEGHRAFVMLPENVGENTPWVWYAPTVKGTPAQTEVWMFNQFLEKGIAIAGVDVGESFGHPQGRKVFGALHSYLVSERGFSSKPCLLARSRGGLMLYNWAVENPDKVGGVAGIYPVCNLDSYPGIANAAAHYGISAAELRAQIGQHSPVSRIAPLAGAGVPVYHIHGDSDDVVPFDANSQELAKRYRAAGGRIELEVVAGGEHDGWEGWFQSQPLTDFAIACALGQPLAETFGTSPLPGTALFNGNDLSGWNGDPEFWRVENGVIVGETTEAKPTQSNTFLIWEGGEVSDFELTFKARVIGNNSGIQYRSKVVDPAKWGVGGYQMDLIGAPHLFGMLYEERGRGILAQRGQSVVLRKGADPEVVHQADTSAPLEVADWNEYRIVARGHELTHYVNGVVTARVTDEDVEARAMAGVLAVQLHAGPPTRVELKDLRYTNFSEQVSTELAREPDWIWKGLAEQPGTVYARRQWTQRAEAQSAELQITADNSFTAYINGQLLGKGTSWVQGYSFDLTPFLKAGDNVLAIEAVNEGGPAGLVAQIEMVDAGGVVTRVETNDEWQVIGELHEGWMAPSIDPTGWEPATVVGSHGDLPWGSPLTRTLQKVEVANLETDAVVHPEGFEIEKLYNVDKTNQGSWVAMAVDDKGRFYCSDEREKGIFRLTFGESGTPPTVEKLEVPVSGAQGLLWAHGCLYAGLNHNTPGAGLYRITDTNGDDRLDHLEELRGIRQGGEHGIHAVVLHPNGEDLFLAAGNHSPTPAPETSSMPLNYDEDQLLPPMVDTNGHAAAIKAPGGWIARTNRDGSAFHLMAGGFRNQYDIAFNAHGEMFTYDSDMEWDLGTPWYRPTRIYHVVDGADYGWRTGSGKFPAHYPDVLPPALEVGPGSPTGVVSGLGAKFPAKYQNAIYAFDWTYGTIYALHPVPHGSTYHMEKEEFVTGTPLMVTDGVIAPDGNFYLATGGRGNESAIYRVRYTGSEATAAAPVAAGEEAGQRELRRQMEALQGETAGAVEQLWPNLGHEDRFIRSAARVALEHQPVALWADKAVAESTTQASLSALLALSRQGAPEHQAGLVGSLKKLFQSELTEAQRLEALRVLSLAIIRMGTLPAATGDEFVALLSPTYPAASDALNRELVCVLVSLGAPDVLAKTIPLLSQDAVAAEAAQIDPELLKRSGMGNAFAQTAASNPQSQQIWYAFVLRHVTEGWTPELRKQYFSWFGKAKGFKGGASFAGFLERARDEALARISDEAERVTLLALSTVAAPTVPAGFEQARVVSVGVQAGLRFSVESLEAKAGEKLAIEFSNDDPAGLMHNLAMIAPGSLEKVVTASMQLGPKAIEMNFIPDIPEVLGSTPQVAPGRKFTLYFAVPAEAGDYPYVCTYPGHGMIMNGVVKVAP